MWMQGKTQEMREMTQDNKGEDTGQQGRQGTEVGEDTGHWTRARGETKGGNKEQQSRNLEGSDNASDSDKGSGRTEIKRETSYGFPELPPVLLAWQKVAQKNVLRDDQSSDLKDVEDQLKCPDPEDGSMHFKEWFSENGKNYIVEEPESDGLELNESERDEPDLGNTKQDERLKQQDEKRPKKACRRIRRLRNLPILRVTMGSCCQLVMLMRTEHGRIPLLRL